MPNRILSVSYDESLLWTRQMLLRKAGYEVTSALSFPEALECCKKGDLDLVIIGHSIPREDKRALAQEAKRHPKTKVLSVLRSTTPPLAEADYSVKSDEGPEALIIAVQKVLGETEDQS